MCVGGGGGSDEGGRGEVYPTNDNFVKIINFLSFQLLITLSTLLSTESLLKMNKTIN